MFTDSHVTEIASASVLSTKSSALSDIFLASSS